VHILAKGVLQEKGFNNWGQVQESSGKDSLDLVFEQQRYTHRSGFSAHVAFCIATAAAVFAVAAAKHTPTGLAFLAHISCYSTAAANEFHLRD
jgi:hypothetical protein